MISKIYVYADWVGLEEPTLIGALKRDRKGIDETYSFCFSNGWLVKHSHLLLSADIKNWSNWQYFDGKNKIPGMFSDVMPDRWGRILLTRREQMLAQKENRSVKSLSDFDMLMLIHDAGRMGGLRFKERPECDFINNDEYLSTPPFSKLRDLEYWCGEFEEGERRKMPPEEKWFANLVIPSSGLGGARPKANILDEQGILHIAKFPSRTDSSDKELWEHFSHIMASHCGVNAAETRLVQGGSHHIMLSRRFDRTNEGKRIHLASAMTLLGLEDGCCASTNNGYLDIVDFFLRNTSHAEQQLRELYRRVAFNIIIGNSDDHFRNHAFLLLPSGWELSPAYDINPSNEECQSLLINSDTSKADLKVLIESSEEYMIGQEEARGIVEDVQEKFKDWRDIAKNLQIPRSEIQLFENRFDTMCHEDLDLPIHYSHHR